MNHSQQGVVREALEETMRGSSRPRRWWGSISLASSAPATHEDITYLRFAYCGSVGDELPGRTLDTGIVRTLWMTPDELRASTARHRSALVLQCVEDHLAGRRYPLDLVTTDASVVAPEVKR